MSPDLLLTGIDLLCGVSLQDLRKYGSASATPLGGKYTRAHTLLKTAALLHCKFMKYVFWKFKHLQWQMINNCCVVCCTNCVGKKKTSVSTVWQRPNLDLPHMGTLKVVEGFQALPLHQLLSSVDPRALDVIAKDFSYRPLKCVEMAFILKRYLSCDVVPP